jgi:hypothetical protein
MRVQDGGDGSNMGSLLFPFSIFVSCFWFCVCVSCFSYEFIYLFLFFLSCF